MADLKGEPGNLLPFVALLCGFNRGIWASTPAQIRRTWSALHALTFGATAMRSGCVSGIRKTRHAREPEARYGNGTPDLTADFGPEEMSDKWAAPWILKKPLIGAETLLMYARLTMVGKIKARISNWTITIKNSAYIVFYYVRTSNLYSCIGKKTAEVIYCINPISLKNWPHSASWGWNMNCPNVILDWQQY